MSTIQNTRTDTEKIGKLQRYSTAELTYLLTEKLEYSVLGAEKQVVCRAGKFTEPYPIYLHHFIRKYAYSTKAKQTLKGSKNKY